MGRFLINHWRGNFPNYISLFGILIGLRILIHFLYQAIPANMPMPGAILFIAADVLFLMWQIAGVLRSSERNMKKAGNTALFWGSYGLSAAAALVMAFDATSLVSRVNGANPLPVADKLELQVNNDTVIITGFIGFDTHTALLSLLQDPERNITTARLSSDGGRIYAARAIAKALIRRGIDTEVAGRCASACALIFLAGKNRRLLDGGQLGFHQYSQTSNVPLLDTAEEQEKDRVYFRARGVSDEFITRMFQAKHEDIWFPDRQELTEAGVLTE